MLGGMMILLAFQFAGESLANATGIPVPGPVVGMFLLFIALMIYGKVPHGLQTASTGLLNNLSLLFVPAGVVAFLHADELKHEWLPILVAVVGSTVLAMGVSGFAFVWLDGRKKP